jgi:hypothetical protein
LVKQEVGRRMADTRQRPALPKEVQAAIGRMWPVLDGVDLVRRLLTRRAELEAAAEGVFDHDEQALVRRGAKAPWTGADLALVDEARGHLDGPPAVYGHVVVDEAQDLSPLALRMIARRCPTAPRSWGPGRRRRQAPAWDVALAAEADGVVAFTIGYRALARAGGGRPLAAARGRGGPPVHSPPRRRAPHHRDGRSGLWGRSRRRRGLAGAPR